MNCPRAANRPISCCTLLLVLGDSEFRIVLSCAGFDSIPLCVTMKPKNRSELTPKAHFNGLSFMLYALRISVWGDEGLFLSVGRVHRDLMVT